VFSVVACAAWVGTLAWTLSHKNRRYEVSVILLATLFWWLGESVALRLGRYQYSPYFPLSINPWGGSPASPDFLAKQLQALLSTLPVDEAAPLNCPKPQASWNVPLPVVAIEAALLFWFLRVSILRLTGAPLRAAVAAACLNGLLMLNLTAVLDPVVSTTQWCGQPLLDPHQSGLTVINLWSWFTDEMHPGYWFGVPLVNYAAWFLTIAVFTFVMRLDDGRPAGVIARVNRRLGVFAYGAALLGIFALLFPLKLLVDLLLEHGHKMISPDANVGRAWQFSVMLGLLGSGVAVFARFAQVRPHPRIPWLAAMPQLLVLTYCLWALTVQPKSTIIAVWLVSAATAVTAMYLSTRVGRKASESTGRVRSHG